MLSLIIIIVGINQPDNLPDDQPDNPTSPNPQSPGMVSQIRNPQGAMHPNSKGTESWWLTLKKKQGGDVISGDPFP